MVGNKKEAKRSKNLKSRLRSPCGEEKTERRDAMIEDQIVLVFACMCVV